MTLEDENALTFFERRILGKIFGPYGIEVNGETAIMWN
jgi:hypothetical protein